MIRVFARGSGKSLTLQRGIPIIVEVPEYDSKDYEISYNRKVTYRKRKAKQNEKHGKHGLQGRGGKIMTQETNQNEVVVQNNAVAKRNDGSNYISAILEETKQGFVEANNGLDMDFVRMGEWLTVNKKGNFVEKDDENVMYGDNIDVVIGYGEQRWSVWGNKILLKMVS